MRTFLALIVLALATSFASAAPVTGRLILRDAGINLEPGLIFPTVFHDVYEVQLNNPNDAATSVELSFPGNYPESHNVTFKAGTELPVVFGFEVPDSFFVLPDGVLATDVLGVGTIDDETLLASTFTLPGSQPLVPSGVSTIAVLTVLEGTVLDVSQFSGSLGFPNVIVFIPEPTSALLISIGLAGFVLQHRS